MKYNVGDRICGFDVNRVRYEAELNGTLVEMSHCKTGTELCWLDNGESNKLFSIIFKTLPENSTGIFHILEHSTLCGSMKYPVREPFVDLLKSSMKTFLNAITWPDKTAYPVASRNDEDYINLMSVYLDAVFAPRFLSDPNIFYQEGWHIEQDENRKLSYKGVVFNEMKGAMSDEGELINEKLTTMLFPETCYGYNSGGDPTVIPDLTYELFVETYNRFYHPSNARIYLDGNVPLEKTLGVIDSYLDNYEKSDKLPVDIMQPLVSSEETNYYEIAQGQSAENKGRLTIGKIYGDWTDRVGDMALYVLNDVLTGSNEAPLKKAVLESGLAKNLTMSIDDFGLQHYFWITMKDVQDGADAKLMEIIRDAAAKLQKDGLDHDALHASINSLEFRLRSTEEPSALFRCFNAASGWMYGGDPLEGMVYAKDMARLRALVDDGYFEKLTGRILLDDTGLAVLHTLPSANLGEEMRAVEQARLDKVAEGWSDTDFEANAAMNEKLVRWQQTPDTPEQLATLPVLPLSAVSEEPVFTPTVEKDVGGVKMLYHPVASNGIVHMSAYFNLSDCTLEELTALSMLSRLLGKLPTEKHDALELQQLVKRYVGRLDFRVDVFAKNDDTKTCTPCLIARCSVLEQHVEKAQELMAEILTATDFGQTEQIAKIIAQADIASRQMGAAAGHMLGMAAALSHYSAKSAVTEAVSGYSSIQWLHGFAADIDGRLPGFVELLNRFRTESVCRNRLTLSVTFTGEFVPEAFLAALPEGVNAAGAAAYSAGLPEEMGARIPAQASYAVRGYNLEKCGAEYDAAYKVAANIITYDFLWNEIRVQGGAYGTGLNVEANGNINAYSFRDPTPARTLDVYGKIAEYLRGFCDRKEEIVKYIISTVAKIEPLQSPRVMGETADADWFSGVTAEDYAKVKREILSADHAKLMKFADILDSFASEGAVCVVGHEAALNLCSGLEVTDL